MPTTYQAHIKAEIPKLRGEGLTAQQAMSAAAKSWRETKKQGGGARASSRQGSAALAQLEALDVPTTKPKQGRAKRQPPALQLENCTDVESCKLQIRMLLADKPPAWLKGSEGKVRKLVELLQTEDEIAKAIEAGKRRLGGVDREIMQLANSLPI